MKSLKVTMIEMPFINAKKMRILNNKEAFFTNRDKILLSNQILEK